MREATRHKTRKKGAGTSSDITRHHRVRDDRRVPYRPSPGPATRMVVACRRARRRAWRRGWSSRAVVSVAGHGVPYGPVRAGWPVAGSRAVGPVAISRIVTSLSDSATSMSLPCPRSGIPKARRLPCPGPTVACSRRRQPLCANIYSFTRPWRFMNARSAARLRRIVGPPTTRHADAGRSYTDLPSCRTATSAYRSPFIGIGARENRRSITPMPNRDDRAPIHTGHIVRA